MLFKIKQNYTEKKKKKPKSRKNNELCFVLFAVFF